VPDDVHHGSRREAAVAGKSLPEHPLEQLSEEANTPTLDEPLEHINCGSGGRFPLEAAVDAVRRDRDER
jgi:hypothetical protein